MKTPEGEVKMAVLGDSPGPEEYLQHHNAFLRMFARKKWDDELTKLTKAVVTAAALEDSQRRDRVQDVPEDNSVGGGGSRAQQGPSP